MIILINFLLSFSFSFVGSIPPGTLNLSIVQLGLEKKMNIAWRFALAASLIEYPYAWLAVVFERLITSSPLIVENFQLITAVVMLVLGLMNLRVVHKPSAIITKFNNSGFRRGILLSILNPLAMPFWIAVTAYLKSQKWIDLSSPLGLHSYLLGVSVGGLSLLILLAYLAKKVVVGLQYNLWLKRIPGVTLLLLGLYSLVQYFF